MIKRELSIFLVVGLLTVLIDFVVYSGLVWFGIAGVSVAKAAGFFAGTLFAYFANRFWTFSHTSPASGSMWRFILLYILTLGVNVVVNAFALKLLVNAVAGVQVAFLLATGVSATLNFLGMKWLVFRSRTTSELT